LPETSSAHIGTITTYKSSPPAITRRGLGISGAFEPTYESCQQYSRPRVSKCCTCPFNFCPNALGNVVIVEFKLGSHYAVNILAYLPAGLLHF
jgi:hypothetical protein